MFGSSLDDQFINRSAAVDSAHRSRGAWPVIVIVLLGIAAFVTWAWFFEIEERTSGQGRVIPSSQLQVVQSLEGGIVREIRVASGELVEAGQVLMTIDDTGFSSTLGELTSKRQALLAEQMRLRAEARGDEELNFPEDFAAENAALVAGEMEVFRSRRRQLEAEIEVLDDRLIQRRAELEEARARQVKLTTTAEPLRKETELTRRLLRRGVVPEVEYLRLASRIAEIDGDIAVAEAQIPKLEAAISEAEKQIVSTRNTYKLAANERLATLQGELAVLQQTEVGAEDRVSRTQLRSPVRGVVNKVNIATVGAVVQPGAPLVEVVPSEDGLLVEASIRPQDVAFIRVGGKASVKLTAYDYLIYGALDGEVTRIGADSITDQNGEQFFQITVKTEKNHLGDDPTRNLISPGMVASVDIQTGTNTVLTYLLKPVLRAQAEALRER
ncbi:MAG: HlyD family type I secretion periplasmic adaptor subunit [Pseudomonadota bacterium]